MTVKHVAKEIFLMDQERDNLLLLSRAVSAKKKSSKFQLSKRIRRKKIPRECPSPDTKTVDSVQDLPSSQTHDGYIKPIKMPEYVETIELLNIAGKKN